MSQIKEELKEYIKKNNVDVVKNPFKLTEEEKKFSESTQNLMVLAKRSWIK